MIWPALVVHGRAVCNARLGLASRAARGRVDLLAAVVDLRGLPKILQEHLDLLLAKLLEPRLPAAPPSAPPTPCCPRPRACRREARRRRRPSSPADSPRRPEARTPRRSASVNCPRPGTSDERVNIGVCSTFLPACCAAASSVLPAAAAASFCASGISLSIGALARRRERERPPSRSRTSARRRRESSRGGRDSSRCRRRTDRSSRRRLAPPNAHALTLGITTPFSTAGSSSIACTLRLGRPSFVAAVSNLAPCSLDAARARQRVRLAVDARRRPSRSAGCARECGGARACRPSCSSTRMM